MNLAIKKETINPYVYPILQGIQNQNNHPDIIIRMVADYYCIKLSDFKQNKTRQRHYVEARQVAYWLLEKHTEISLKEISRRISVAKPQFSHATIIHGIKTINNLLENDKKIKQTISLLDLKIAEYLQSPNTNL
jgi:chromosomal replication initiation ATPase DnaA